jgi:multisubunit Na+/H+ antiporter MnhE subunit
MTRIVLTTAALAAIYALTLGTTDPWDLAAGMVLGLSVVLVFRRFLFTEPEARPSTLLRRAAGLPALLLATVIDITRGTLQVARIVLSPGPPRHAGFVEIPIGERTPTGVVVSGMLNTLSPGSVLVDIDPAAGTWTIHALDTADEEGLREDVQRFYERYQRHVWP